MMEVLSLSQCQRDDKYIFILLTLRVDRELRNLGGGVLLLEREGGYKGLLNLFVLLLSSERSMCGDRDHKF